MKKLTPKEQEILELIGKGYSSNQIAFVQQISQHTVETHRKSLLAKFNAKNAAELVVKAIQNKSLNVQLRLDDTDE